ncbi:hypothetical protein EHM69_05190 [candidate division KSB1 bacterium]|nr:MAG: hypothetical protein EHM69_05190 [candidate division KSB1 bacterium]
MHYSDLVQRTAALSEGRHVIYEMPEGRVEIRNIGVGNPQLSARPEFRLYLFLDGREMQPRHSDFFCDYLLKIETRPDLHLPLTEACEQVCNGTAPTGVMTAKRLPRKFAETGESTWSMQTSMYANGGLPTELFLCGLQGLLRVYELNHWLDNSPEAFRQVFLKLEKGQPYVDVVRDLFPLVRPEKRYFDRMERCVKA